MTNSSAAEIYFIAGMMILILFISIPATYLFFRQYKREKSESQNAMAENENKKNAK